MCPCQPVGRPSSCATQSQDDQLELGRGRGGSPEEADRVERRGQQLGEDPGLGPADREIREEARVLPVRDAGQEDLVEIAQHRLERLRLLGRRRRQP